MLRGVVTSGEKLVRGARLCELDARFNLSITTHSSCFRSSPNIRGVINSFVNREVFLETMVMCTFTLLAISPMCPFWSIHVIGPSCTYSLWLAQFRPIKRTPEELKRLLEARADPDIVRATDIWGTVCPLGKIFIVRHEHLPIQYYTKALSPRRISILPGALVRAKILSLITHTCIRTR